MECKHEELQFGSGDYYLFCHACHRRWAMMGDRPEYDLMGKIGADPSKCVPGFYSNEPRVAPSTIKE